MIGGNMVGADIVIIVLSLSQNKIIIKHKFINTTIPMFYLKIRFSKSKWFPYNAVKHTDAFRKYMTI
jgi:hypothetical protein